MNLLFELFVEELPASEMSGLDNRINNTLTQLLDAENVSYENPIIYVTPRRMAIKLTFDEYVKAEDKEIVGPPKNVCFKNEEPTKALIGFLKKNRASMENMFIKKTKKGEYAAILLKGENRESKPIVKTIINTMLNKLHFNKKMRWGIGEFEFIRPVHNITFMINDIVEEFEFASKKATSFTYGHRFLSNGKLEVTFNSYEQTLKNNFVVVDQKERKSNILKQLNDVCKELGLDVVYDDELLDEIVNLTEYPKVVLGEFEDRFLKLPKEVLITSMKDHQRYFAFIKNNKLSNRFAAVSNIETDNMNLIKQGYERVLRARFSDAEFFFDEDSKHKLEEFVEPLKNMMFHEKLGTQYERIERLSLLSEFLAENLGFDKEKAKRAAYLSKADLLTQMVYEFPELQGVMGKEYALLSGENSEVAQAIYEQYLPKDDEVPETKTGSVLSLADKFDLIVGGFIANLKPTGTKDPYALRRAALGIIRITIENKINLQTTNIIEKSKKLYKKNVSTQDINEFIKTRFINYLGNYPHDALESVTSNKFDDIYDAYLRLESINKLFKNDQNKEKRFSVKRVFNILKDYDKTEVDASLFNQQEEERLFEEVKKLENKVSILTQEKKYDELLSEIVSIKDVINEFFDNVMVMDKNEKIKENRLSLLNRLRKIVLNIADFKFLEI